MPESVSLSLLKRHPSKWSNGSTVTEIHRERLVALYYLFGKRTPIHECLIDTGALLTVLPQRIWEPHTAEIEWLAPHAWGIPSSLTSINGLTGGSIACRIGIVDLNLIDTKKRELRRRVVAKCALDGEEMRQALFGLGGNTYEGSRLHLGYAVFGDNWNSALATTRIPDCLLSFPWIISPWRRELPPLEASWLPSRSPGDSWLRSAR